MKAFLSKLLGFVISALFIIIPLAIFVMPITFLIILPETAWGISFLSELKIEHYSLYMPLYKFSHSCFVGLIIMTVFIVARLICRFIQYMFKIIRAFMNTKQGGERV